MGKFNERLMGLFGISNRSKGRVVSLPSMTTEEKKEPPSVTSTSVSIDNTEATVPSAEHTYSSTVGDVKLSTASVAKMMEYTYGYKLKSIDGFVIENVTKHPNLNVVMYTMLHLESNTRIKIGKDVFELLFESAGENK